MGTRSPPRPWRMDEGRVHHRARHPTFDRSVALAFDQIRHFGASNPAIAQKLLEVLARLASLVPPSRRPVLLAQAEAVLEDARARIESAGDRVRVEEIANRVLRR
jgi:uncharacterized membrane protein